MYYICFEFVAVPDVIHAVAKYEVELEPREIFFFREGSIVMWNISDLESGNLLQFLKHYEQNCYTEELVHTETEFMNYTYADSGYFLLILLQQLRARVKLRIKKQRNLINLINFQQEKKPLERWRYSSGRGS